MRRNSPVYRYDEWGDALGVHILKGDDFSSLFIVSSASDDNNTVVLDCIDDAVGIVNSSTPESA